MHKHENSKWPNWTNIWATRQWLWPIRNEPQMYQGGKGTTHCQSQTHSNHFTNQRNNSNRCHHIVPFSLIIIDAETSPSVHIGGHQLWFTAVVTIDTSLMYEEMGRAKVEWIKIVFVPCHFHLFHCWSANVADKSCCSHADWYRCCHKNENWLKEHL